MTDTRKVLGQSIPASKVLTDGYTVPALTSAVISTIVMCNQGWEEAEVRVAVAVAGAADDPKQYSYHDMPIPSKRTFTATLGITLGAGDVVRVYSDTGSVSFNIFGMETS